MVCMCRQSSHYLPNQTEMRTGSTQSIIKTNFTERDLEISFLDAYCEKLKPLWLILDAQFLK